jgi:transposase-like protein
MEDYPQSLLDLESRFATEDACQAYLAKLRWPSGFRCPRCSLEKAWIRSNGLFECSNCRLQTSVTAGTIFQDTKKPLSLWFKAIWHVTSQKYGANALGIQRVLNFGSYRTAWAWLQKLRRAMVRPDRDLLSGIVQVDETFVGGPQKGKRGRGAEGKILILIFAQGENRIGRISLCVIPDASAENLVSEIQKNVATGSTIQTDGWLGYSKRLETSGYTHKVVRDTSNVGDDLLPKCQIIKATPRHRRRYSIIMRIYSLN